MPESTIVKESHRPKQIIIQLLDAADWPSQRPLVSESSSHLWRQSVAHKDSQIESQHRNWSVARVHQISAQFLTELGLRQILFSTKVFLR